MDEAPNNNAVMIDPGVYVMLLVKQYPIKSAAAPATLGEAKLVPKYVAPDTSK
jgi:hypothetical protein